MSYGLGRGHGHAPSFQRDWCFRGVWLDDPRIGRRDRTWSRVDDEPAVEALEMRLAGLHGTIQRLGTESAELRSRRMIAPISDCTCPDRRRMGPGAYDRIMAVGNRAVITDLREHDEAALA
jgi:hypothetical protein